MVVKDKKKDLCQTCEHYWLDFPMPLDGTVSHCEILDKNGTLTDMNKVVPFPCVECPFGSYKKRVRNDKR